MIGKEDIEEKIFQYFEGELSANESLELESFIKNNPEYQVDFDAWQKSVVEDENREYKFVNELLVNESLWPKSWIKWAFAGCSLFGFIMASSVLMNKYNGGMERLNSQKIFNSQSDTENKISLVQVVPSENQKQSEISQNNAGIRNTYNNQNNPNSAQAYSPINLKTNVSINSRENSLIQSIPLFPTKEILKDETIDDNSLISVNSEYSRKKSNNENLTKSKIDVNKLVNEDLIFSHISIGTINLQKIGSEKNLPPTIRKSKFNYENPNQPKLFFVNNRDPYLNYALAHTIEENGSFVGDFNGGKGIRAEMLYRTEWPSVSSENFTSQIYSIDSKIDALKGGLGLLINADRIGHGKLNSTAVSLIYSPKFIAKNISFEPSFKYTYNQKNIAWNQVEKNDVKDPRNGVLYASIPFIPEGTLTTDIVHHDVGFGILINTEKVYLGGQIDHLNKDSYSDDYFDQTIEVPFKISAMIGTEIMKNRESQFKVAPSLNYIQFGVYNALWANAQIFYNGFFVSGGVATNEELMTSLGYANNKVRLVYGLGFSKPREFSGLPLNGDYYESHQLSVRVNLKPKK